MRRKLFGIFVFAMLVTCGALTSSDQVYASEQEEVAFPTGDLCPQEPEIIDDNEAVALYEMDEENEIDTQSSRSSLEIYQELESRIKTALLQGESVVDVGDLNISRDSCTLDFYYAYSPYFFDALDISCWMSMNQKYVYIELDNPWTLEQTKEYFAKVDAQLTFYQSLVNESMNEEEKALTIHDYIVSHSQYDTSYVHNRCGDIFMDGSGVCQSYAFAYMYIMNSMGIETHFVSSSSMNHSWNIIRINGQFYHVDCTFDDPLNEKIGLSCHTYFLLSDTAITELGHSDWVADGLICTSDIYADAYWRNSVSPVIILDNNSYYSPGNTLIKRDNEFGVETTLISIDSWNNYGHTGLFYLDGSLYYNSSSEIRAYNINSGLDTLICRPGEDGGIVNGCRSDGAKIIFALCSNANQTGDLYEITGSIEGWLDTNNGRMYYENGQPVTGWKQIDSAWYYFESNGIMTTGTWKEISGNRYYFETDGKMQTNRWIGDYYVKSNGIMAKSEWISKDYYVDANGKWDKSKKTQWVQSGNRWWYRHADGSYTKNGWESIGENWYHFDASGWMESSKWIGDYYVKSNGTMAKSEWINKDYYVDTNGKWDKSKKTQWVQSGNRWWYRHADGSYTKNGWESIGGNWYHFDASGWMESSKWIEDYYVKSNGVMAKSEWVDNGKYYVDASGKWVPNAKKTA